MSGVSHQERGPNRWAYVVTIVAMAVLAAAIAGFIAGHVLGLL